MGGIAEGLVNYLGASGAAFAVAEGTVLVRLAAVVVSRFVAAGAAAGVAVVGGN